MTKYYSYYHCTDGDNCRFRADNANDRFIDEIERFVPRPENADLIKLLSLKLGKNKQELPEMTANN